MNFGSVLTVKGIQDMVESGHGGHCLDPCIAFPSEAGLIVPADRMAGALFVLG
jgi:hypothetical protein